MAFPIVAMIGTGRIAPEKRTCGKQSMGSAIVAWAGPVTAAEVSNPRASAASASSRSVTVTSAGAVARHRTRGPRASLRVKPGFSTTTTLFPP
jgi:hypothetical protein